MTDKLLPYLVPLVFAVLILRRATQARRISPSRMWIAPTLFAVLTGLALAAEPVPGLAVIGAFVAAAIAGAGLDISAPAISNCPSILQRARFPVR